VVFCFFLFIFIFLLSPPLGFVWGVWVPPGVCFIFLGPPGVVFILLGPPPGVIFRLFGARVYILGILVV
jgi:hypothetical protein